MIRAGVEVKPGKPYTHSYNPSHGRLRICQVAHTPLFFYFTKVMFCLTV